MATQHTVVFHSPGTFFAESSSYDVEKPDVKEAVKMAADVLERYNAKPFGFQFVEYLTAPDVPDGNGGTLRVERKEVRRSGTYFITGRLRKLEEVEADADKESILLSNMKCNDMPVMVENTNSWKSTHAFGEDDVLLDAAGEVVVRGNSPTLVEYRRKTIERVKQERGY